VDELLAHNITPYITMFHWDLPQALPGGWRSRDTSKAFADYAGFMAKHLSDRVHHFMTTNEFICFTDSGYKTGQFAPGLKLPDAAVNQVRHHGILAHGLGVQAIRANAPSGTQVGLAENAVVVCPVLETPEHIEAAQKATRDVNAPFLTTVLEGKYPDSYLVHEYLEGTNHPFYFRDFAARSASHGLQYLGDAIQNGIVGAENSPGFRNWLEANARDLIRLEQYADFVRNRVFRRALLCRENVTLDRSQLPARAETMQVAAFFRQTAEANGMTRFQHSLGARRVVGPGPLHDALVRISGRFPHAIAVAEVVGAAGGQHRELLLHELVNCWMNGMLELYADAPPVLARSPSDKPRASSVARYLAAQNESPVNQRHGSITVDATQRQFIQLLDGTRTRDQLAAALGMPRAAIDQLVQFTMNAALLED